MVVFFKFSSTIRCMRRVGVENLIPLDLEIKETLRKIRRDKRATDLEKQQPMDNMNDFREEKVNSIMGDGTNPDIAQLDNVLRPSGTMLFRRLLLSQ